MSQNNNKYRFMMTAMGGQTLAHVSRLIEIGNELKADGHEVFFAYGGILGNIIEEAGFINENVPEHPPEFYMDPKSMNVGNWHDVDSLERFVDGDLRAVEKYKPDMIINDTRITARMSALLSNLPIAQLIETDFTPYSAIKLKTFHAFQPPLYSKLKAVEWFSDNVMMPAMWKLGLKVWVKEYNKFGAKRGLKKFKTLNEVMAGDIYLLPDFPEFRPPKNLPDNYYQVGPITWGDDVPLPAWFSNLDRNRPIIYMTQGGTGVMELFKTVFEALGNTDVQVVMTTGSNCDPGDFSEIPTNFYIEKYLPGRKVMEVADLLIFHGGSGTCFQAMQEGVPAIVIPNVANQESIGERLQQLGMGKMIFRDKLTVKKLKHAIDEIMGDEKYTENAKALKERVKHYSGAKRAAELVIDFLNKYKNK